MHKPWLGGSVAWCVVPYNKRLQVWPLVSAFLKLIMILYTYINVDYSHEISINNHSALSFCFFSQKKWGLDILSLLPFGTSIPQKLPFWTLTSLSPSLRLKQPRARKMLDEGVIVALGSDFNPNAYCFSMVIIFNMPFRAECQTSIKHK